MIGHEKAQRKSIATNGAFTFVAKIVTMIVPFVVYPIVMRVLGAESFGKVIYAESLVSYFSLLAILGIESYAQRECAVVRDDNEKLKKVASQVFAINLIMTGISLLIYLCLVFFIPSMQSERPLFLVFSLWIVGSGMAMNWLYMSQERFDIISIREIVAKLLYLVLCITLIKSSENYFTFGCIVVFTGTVFTMLWNYFGIIKGEIGVTPNLKYSSGFTECLKPIIFLALLTIGSKLFTDFDVLMIKWFVPVDSNKAVGLYNSAIIIPRAVDAILMTVSAVITPRLFIATRQKDEKSVFSIVNNTSNALFLIAIPAIITCLFFSKEILLVFAGDEYVAASSVLQIYSIVILGVLVITLAGTRTYIARQKERKLFHILMFGAALNIVLNYIFIKMWGITGAAFATLSSYIVVMSVELTLEHTWHYIFTRDKLNYILAGVAVTIVFALVKFFFVANPATTLFMGIGLAGICYLTILYVVKENTLLRVQKQVVKYIKKK